MPIRLHTTDPLHTGATITLPPDPSHYLINVMRRVENDIVHLFNTSSGEWRAEIITAHKKHTVVHVTDQVQTPRAEPDLWLLYAPVKNAAHHFIVQKATELGVSYIQPIITERTHVNRVNEEKLHLNAIEAAEQCGRLSIPVIAPAVTLRERLTSWPTDRTLIFCDESGQGQYARDALSACDPHGKYAVLIGPEGGFSPIEQHQIATLPHSKAIGLGPRILRADTAVVSALTAVSLFVGDWDIAPKFSNEP